MTERQYKRSEPVRWPRFWNFLRFKLGLLLINMGSSTGMMNLSTQKFDVGVWYTKYLKDISFDCHNNLLIFFIGGKVPNP